MPARPNHPLSTLRPLSLGLRSPAFTLIELLVTITVIAILASLTLAAMRGVNQKTSRDKAKAEIAAISNALEQYKSVNDTYPPAGGNGTVPMDSIRPFYIANRVQTNDAGEIVSPFGKGKPTPYYYLVPGSQNRASFDVYTIDDRTGESIGNW